MLNLIGCASLWYAVICSKSGRIRQFPGLDTPRFKEVSGDRIFLATEKVRIGENMVPDTRRTRRVSWNMILPDLPVFSKNTGPYRGISGPRHVFFHAVGASWEASQRYPQEDAGGMPIRHTEHCTYF